MAATISILGIYQWYPNIFSGLVVPDGVNLNLAIQSILNECAELELLYSAPVRLQAMIGNWSARRKPIWEKLYATTQLKYNPIENYDRMEDWEDDYQNSHKNSNHNYSKEENKTEGKVGGLTDSNDILSVKGFDSGDFVDKEQRHNHTESGTISEGTGAITTNSNGGAKGTETGKNTRKGRAHGNIGVTTTQAMIRQERDIVDFDIYAVIVQDFQKAFCLSVY